MTTKYKPKSLAFDVTARTLVFRNLHRDREYLWGEGETSDIVGPARLMDVNADWGWGNWYLFWIADCAFPPLFVVQHTSFEDAYAEFIDWQTDMIKIDEDSLDDYKDESGELTCDFNSTGVPVDVENIGGEEVKLIRIEC